MKILWLVNIIMPELSVYLGKNPSVFGGWLSGAMQAVRKSGYELVICTTDQNVSETEKYIVNDVTYYICKRSSADEMEQSFKVILEDEKPDIVHIYGTEFEHSWAVAKQTDPDRTLISLQGLIGFINQHAFGGVPESIAKDKSMHKLLRKLNKGGNSIEHQFSSYAERGETEKLALKKVHFINGGTHWGNGCVKLLNPGAELLDCGLILRDSFYDGKLWNIDQIDRHSIYAVFSASPVKGFDMLLKALPYVIERFPDTKVYAAGKKLTKRNYSGIKKAVMDTAPDYEWYIQTLINEYKLQDHVVFMGYLDESKVKERLLKTNVFVSASAIENHSTALGEAMILGVPSVASCVGGLQEMIDHGKDGFLYPFDEPYILAYYICRIFGDDELAEKFSALGHNHASASFSRDGNTEKLLAMYRTISDRNCKE